MSKKQIEEAIREFLKTSGMGPSYTQALASHLDAVLPPTFDEVVALGKIALKSEDVELIIDSVDSGSIRSVALPRPIIYWPASSSLGKDIIAAIKAAMPPEPTLNEKGLEALKRIFAYNGRYPVTWIAEDYQTVREALEAKG